MAIIIGLDAGHGGNSSGTYSIDSTKDGLFEKDYCLDLVKRVGKILTDYGVKVIYTRTTDINVGEGYKDGAVTKRALMCVEAKCNYAVSIHFNGFENESANGCEVYVPYAEKGAGIEAGYSKYLGKFFKLRAPFARANNYYSRNEVYDKKLNVSTRKFENYKNGTDYFGFIRTCWKNGISADLLEVCFLTNRKDFDTYTKNTDAIAEAIARSILEGYKIEWKEEAPKEPEAEKGKFYIYFEDRAKAENFAKSVGAVVDNRG